MLKKGDHISFYVGSDAWWQVGGVVCEVEYVSQGCTDPDCGHDDCWREPYVSVRPLIHHGVALADVETVFNVDGHGRAYK